MLSATHNLPIIIISINRLTLACFVPWEEACVYCSIIRTKKGYQELRVLVFYRIFLWWVEQHMLQEMSESRCVFRVSHTSNPYLTTTTQMAMRLHLRSVCVCAVPPWLLKYISWKAFNLTYIIRANAEKLIAMRKNAPSCQGYKGHRWYLHP